MPLADLPYSIDSLAKSGQYAYLTRPTIRSRAVEGQPDPAPSSRLRVLRKVNLCDGPSLWDSIRVKYLAAQAPLAPDQGSRAPHDLQPPSSPTLRDQRSPHGPAPHDLQSYGFYVALRLFATRAMIMDYLASPELASYCKLKDVPIPTLNDTDPVITEENYLEEDTVKITREEYSRMIRIRDYQSSLQSLEDMLCEFQGIASLEALIGPKRGRKKKSEKTQPAAAPAAPPRQSPPPSDQDEAEEEEAAAAPPAPSAAATGSVLLTKTKKKSKITLRDQFRAVQNTPSRVIDVSGYGDTMQHQKGKVLDRVKHAERISQCTTLSELFPIISDNFPAFERAMATLGSRYTPKITEFKQIYGSKRSLG